MPDYILTVSPPITMAVSILLDIPTTELLADFSDGNNSQYGFLFAMGAGFQPEPPDPSITPFADFSNSENSQYGFLFNLGV